MLHANVNANISQAVSLLFLKSWACDLGVANINTANGVPSASLQKTKLYMNHGLVSDLNSLIIGIAEIYLVIVPIVDFHVYII